MRVRAGLLVLSLAACSAPAPRTQIVVVVDSDLGVPAELDRIEIVVERATATDLASADLRERPLPRSLGLVHDGGPLGPVDVVARGYAGSDAIVESRAIVSFVRDQTLELRLPLERACAHQARACPAGSTCVASVCESAKRAALPTFGGEVVAFAGDPDAGQPFDAARDAAPREPTCPSDSELDGCKPGTVDAGERVTALIERIAQGATTASPFEAGKPIDLVGKLTGVDPLEIEWTDSVLGTIGAAALAKIAVPPIGKHLLSLRVRDGLAREAAATRAFLVTAPGEPLIAPFTDVNSSTSLAGYGAFTVLASDTQNFVVGIADGQNSVRFDGSTLLGTASSQQLADETDDLALDAVGGKAYLATKRGLQICVLLSSGELDPSQCTLLDRHQGLPDNEATALVAVDGSDGAIHWVVGTRKGVASLTAAGDALGTAALSNIEVLDLAAYGGKAWIAAKQGLYAYDPVSGEAQNFDVSAAPASQLDALAVDTDGRIWVASARGIGRFTPSLGVWTQWHTATATTPGLASDAANDIAVARATPIGDTTRDIVWIATAGGISRFDPTLASFTTLSVDEGLPNANVRALVVLANGAKVFATDAGVWLFSGP